MPTVFEKYPEIGFGTGICALVSVPEKIEKLVKSEPGFPVLGQAVPAVDRPSFSRFEGDFALFATV
jgi:hypothetical protein